MSQTKRQQRLATAALPHLAVVLNSVAENAVVMDMRRLKARYITRSAADALLKREHLWQIHTSVFLQVGDQRVTKTQEHTMRERYRYNALVPYLQEFHADQIRAERADHIIGYGWIAMPHARQLDEVAIDAIYGAIE